MSDDDCNLMMRTIIQKKVKVKKVKQVISKNR